MSEAVLYRRAFAVTPFRDSAVKRTGMSPHSTKAGDAALIGRIVAGDEAAFAELYDATSAMVFGLALRILGDRSAAEDVLMEVYGQAWRQADRFDPKRGSAATWLLAMTRSRAIDSLRAASKNQPSDPFEAANAVASDAPDPSEASAAAQQQRLVRNALSSLNHEQREVIELAYFAGLSHTEISAKLGQPVGTVKTRIRSGMLRLRELLQPVLATAPGA